MSEDKVTLTEQEEIIINTATQLHPEADGKLEAIDLSIGVMFRELVKKTGAEFDRFERMYKELIAIANKLRNNPTLLNI